MFPSKSNWLLGAANRGGGGAPQLSEQDRRLHQAVSNYASSPAWHNFAPFISFLSTLLNPPLPKKGELPTHSTPWLWVWVCWMEQLIFGFFQPAITITITTVHDDDGS